MPLASDKSQIFAVVPKELRAKLQAEADAQNRSLSNYVCHLLEQAQAESTATHESLRTKSTK